MKKSEFRFEDFTLDFNSIDILTLLSLYNRVENEILNREADLESPKKDAWLKKVLEYRQKQVKAMKALQFIFSPISEGGEEE